MRGEERGSLYLLTGLFIGLLLGLAYSWWVRPVTYTNTSPASLRADYKERYRALIASAYVASGDLVRARARLDLLQDADVYGALAEQAQRTLAEGSQMEEARALGLLAVALGQVPQAGSGQPAAAGPGGTFTPELPSRTPDLTFTALAATLVSTATFDISTETPTLTMTLEPSETPVVETGNTELPGVETSSQTATWTPLPTLTPTTAPGALLALKSRTPLCDPELGEALIQVEAQDAAGKPLPGVELIVSWQGGEDHFFTGLKPELSLGYADFTMTPGVEYTLRLGSGGEPVADLKPAECQAAGGERYWGSWRLIFTQP